MSILYIAVWLVVIWLIIEILSIVFKITGMDITKARFQVISILTHTGFTTRESELIAQHPLRRKLASVLMLISYVAQASLITLIYNVIVKNDRQLLNIIILLVALVAMLLLITRNKYVSSKFDKFIERFIAKSIMKQTQTHSIDQVLKISPGYAVYEILVDTDSHLANLSLRDARLNEQNIHVLKIDRGSNTVDFPKADFVMQPGDGLIVYGNIKSIKELALHRQG